MKKAEAEFKPTKRAYTKKEGVVEKVKVHRYDPTNEDYTEEDLPFLNKEYERISAIVDNPKTDEEEEEAVDLQDKLYDLIDQLESVSKFRKKTEGKGMIVKPDTKHVIGLAFMKLGSAPNIAYSVESRIRTVIGLNL